MGAFVPPPAAAPRGGRRSRPAGRRAPAAASAPPAAPPPRPPPAAGAPPPVGRRSVLGAAAAAAATAAAAAAGAGLGAPAAAVAAAGGGAPAAAATAAAAAAAPAAGGDEERRPPFVTLPSGVRVQEITAGEGPTVADGSVVSLQYVLRRPNGYFVDASYGFDRLDLYTYTAGAGAVVAGFDDAVRGMRAGGRRRFVVPPAAGYTRGVAAGKPGPIPPGWGERRSLASHVGEDLIFEVRVVKVK